MQPPQLSGLGPGWLADDLKQILNYAGANRPLSGLGTTVFDAPGGRVINANPVAGGYNGPALHNIPDLAGHIPDPVGIVGDVVDGIIGGITIPNPTSFIASLSGAFSDVLNGGDIPDEETVLGWVNTYLGTTLNSLIGDIPAKISEVLDALVEGTPEALSDFFNAEGAPSPRNGDKIYTASAGIVYELWKQSGGVPASNSIFSVPFTIGEGEAAQTWVAITTFPAPNISSLVDAVTSLVMAGLNALMNLLSNLLTASLMALFSLIAAIMPLINALIEAALLLVWAAIDDLWAYLLLVEARVAAIEAELANIQDVSLVDSGGFARNVRVLNTNEGTDMRETVYYIDSNTGDGQLRKMLTWEPDTHLGSVDWKYIYWLAQDGRHWGAKLLSLNTGGYPKLEDAPTGGTAGGAVIGTLYNRDTVVTCDAGTIDILKAESTD